MSGRFRLRLSRDPRTLPLVSIVLLFSLGWAAPDNSVAFTHVRVIPMDSERVLDDWTVVVRDRRIVAAGPAAEIKLSPRSRRIDGRGKYLMPGLVDTHVHVTVKHDLFLFLAAGVTTVQGMGPDPERSRRWARYINDDKILGPNYVNCDSIIYGAKTREEAESFVAHVKEGGFDCIKIYSPPDWTVEGYAALVHAAKREGIRTVGHLPRNLPLDVVLGDGQDAIAHAEEYLYAYFDKQDPSRDESLLASIAKMTADRGIAVTPNLVAYHFIALQIGPNIGDLLKRPELELMPQSVRAAWAPAQNRYRQHTSERDSVPMLQSHAYLQKLTLALQRAGVTLTLGSDSSRNMPFLVPGFSAIEDLRELVAAGLTPFQALTAGTSAAARSLGAASEFGTIAVGQRADLLLLDANPLANIGNVTRRAGVMVRGRWLPEREMAQRLAQHRAAMKQQNAVMAAVAKAGTEGRLDEAVRMYRRANGQSMDEETINEIGCQYMYSRKDYPAAIAVLRFGTALFPSSWNAYDSLGAAYMLQGDKDRAIRNYEKSLDLNPSNTRASEALTKLRFAF